MRPGVTVQEAALPRLVDGSAQSTSYGAFIGTSIQGATDVQLVTSWSNFQTLYGTFSSLSGKATLAMAAYQFFLNGGSAAYIRRVLSSDALTSNLTIPSSTQANVPVLGFSAAAAGVWGNTLSVDVLANSSTTPPSFDILVRQDRLGSSVVAERFPELVMDPNSPRYVEKIVNSTTIGSMLILADDVNNGTLPTVLPEVQADTELAGGSDGVAVITGSDYSNAVDDFDGINSGLIFNVPGLSSVDAVVSKVESRGDSFVVVDSPGDLTVADVESISFPVSSYAAVYYPWLGVPDPASDAPRGALVFIPPGGAVVGMIMRTDTSRGTFKAPAGIGAALSGAVTTQRKLSNADLDSLNDLNINAIRPIPGAGIVAMGARTRDFNTAARYISVRRTLNYVKLTAKETTSFALFEPNTPVLWEQLRVVIGSFLSELWQLGGLTGATTTDAFYVKIDADNNTAASIANGEVHIEIGVAPVYPAEFIIITIGQFTADASVVVSEGTP